MQLLAHLFLPTILGAFSIPPLPDLYLLATIDCFHTRRLRRLPSYAVGHDLPIHISHHATNPKDPAFCSLLLLPFLCLVQLRYTVVSFFAPISKPLRRFSTFLSPSSCCLLLGDEACCSSSFPRCSKVSIYQLLRFDTSFPLPSRPILVLCRTSLWFIQGCQLHTAMHTQLPQTIPPPHRPRKKTYRPCSACHQLSGSEA